jgi:hypothetical protein
MANNKVRKMFCDKVSSTFIAIKKKDMRCGSFLFIMQSAEAVIAI